MRRTFQSPTPSIPEIPGVPEKDSLLKNSFFKKAFVIFLLFILISLSDRFHVTTQVLITAVCIGNSNNAWYTCGLLYGSFLYTTAGLVKG